MSSAMLQTSGSKPWGGVVGDPVEHAQRPIEHVHDAGENRLPVTLSGCLSHFDKFDLV